MHELFVLNAMTVASSFLWLNNYKTKLFAPASASPSSSDSTVLIFLSVSYFPPVVSSHGLWSVSHTTPFTFAFLCCSYPPSGFHGAITSWRPVVRTAVKYRRLATGRLYGTSLPCRHFLTSPVGFLPSCIHKQEKRNTWKKYVIFCLIKSPSPNFRKKRYENDVLSSVQAKIIKCNTSLIFNLVQNVKPPQARITFCLGQESTCDCGSLHARIWLFAGGII